MAHIEPSSKSSYLEANIMPRIVQPGGLSRKVGMLYTARHKLALLAPAKRIVKEEGVTLHRAAERLQVCHSLFVRWQKQKAADVDPILALLKKASRTCPAQAYL